MYLAEGGAAGLCLIRNFQSAKLLDLDQRL
jgi:hypothetical protein